MKNSNAEIASVGSHVPRDRATQSWPMVRRGDVCDEVRERIPSNEIQLAQYVTTDNMIKGCGGIKEAESLPVNVGLVHYHSGYVLVSNIRPYLKKTWLADRSGGCSSDVIVFRSNREDLASEYLYRVLSQDGFFDYSMQNVSGTKMPRGKRDWIKRFEFPLPPLPVQREIVARLEKELGEADALAAKFKGIAENADAEFKAELDETFKNVEGEKMRLGDVCEFLTDGDWIESKDQSENGVRLIQTGNVGIGVFKAKESNAHYISEETFERLKCTEIFNGDVLVSRLPSPVGRACIVNGIEGRMITAVDCSIIRFKDVVVKEYFVAYSQTQGYQAAIDVLTTGTTRARISRKNLASIPVPLLPLSVQREIVTKLDVARERCDKLKLAAERGLRAAEDLRKAILAEAFEQ